MSIIESILFRAMIDIEFADQLFMQPEKALTDYVLTAEELAVLKKLSRVQFEILATKTRESMAGAGRSYIAGHFSLDPDDFHFG